MVAHRVRAVKLPRGAIALFIVGAVGAAACAGGFALAGSVVDTILGYPVVKAGSKAEVDLEGGRQIGWYESTCFGCDGRESVSIAPDLRVVGPSLSSQGEAPIEPYSDGRTPSYSPDGFLNYSDGARDGGPAYRVDIPGDGSYTVTVGQSSDPGAQVRIGPSQKPRKIVGIVLAGGGFLVAGGALFVLAAWWISAMLRNATRNG